MDIMEEVSKHLGHLGFAVLIVLDVLLHALVGARGGVVDVRHVPLVQLGELERPFDQLADVGKNRDGITSGSTCSSTCTEWASADAQDPQVRCKWIQTLYTMYYREKKQKLNSLQSNARRMDICSSEARFDLIA